MRGRGTRTILSIFGGAAALAGCTSILGSFDTARETNASEPDGATSDTGTTSPDGGGGGDDGSTGSDGSVGDETTPPLTCTAPEVVCGTGPTAVCADRDKSPDHCGACGHSCGGGDCSQGHCGTAKLYSGTTIGPLAISDTEIFFESNESPSYKLLACPKSGCKAGPRQVVVMPFSINGIDIPAPGTIAFVSAPQNGSGTEREAIFSCPTTACPALPDSFIGDGLNGVDSRLRSTGGTIYGATGGNGIIWSTCDGGTCATPASHFGSLTRNTHGFFPGPGSIYFIDSSSRGSAISKCTLGDTACTPTPVIAGDASLVEAVVVFSTKLFWLVPGRDGFIEGKLVSCDLPGCATATPQAAALDSPTGLIVDATGAWWLNKAGKIQHCAPNGCAGGAQDIVGPLTSPHHLVMDDAFLYWAETTQVSRLAK